jgi:hypothetical protein
MCCLLAGNDEVEVGSETDESAADEREESARPQQRLPTRKLSSMRTRI